LLDPKRGVIQIPVYLGDSVQWQEQNSDLWAAGNLVIRADDNRELFGSELSFPDGLLAFDPSWGPSPTEAALLCTRRECLVRHEDGVGPAGRRGGRRLGWENDARQVV
jgi:hypothetical protein